MGIHIGMDIGAITLKLAARGEEADRPLLEALRAAESRFRMVAESGLPLIVSDRVRIAGGLAGSSER